jgi:hypothetical protein
VIISEEDDLGEERNMYRALWGNVKERTTWKSRLNGKV